MDTRGRVRASKEQRRTILAEFERSGVSAAQFAKVTGLKYSTLAGWLQRYRRAKPKPAPRGLRLLEAVVEPGPGKERTSGNVLIVRLPGQVRVELSSLAQVPLVAELIKTLQSGQTGC
jgi:transposase-like protein